MGERAELTRREYIFMHILRERERACDTRCAGETDPFRRVRFSVLYINTHATFGEWQCARAPSKIPLYQNDRSSPTRVYHATSLCRYNSRTRMRRTWIFRTLHSYVSRTWTRIDDPPIIGLYASKRNADDA